MLSGCGTGDRSRIEAATAQTERDRATAERTFPGWPDRCSRPMPYVTPTAGESKRSIVGRNDLNVDAENRTKAFCSEFYREATAPLDLRGVRP